MIFFLAWEFPSIIHFHRHIFFFSPVLNTFFCVTFSFNFFSFFRVSVCVCVVGKANQKRKRGANNRAQTIPKHNERVHIDSHAKRHIHIHKHRREKNIQSHDQARARIERELDRTKHAHMHNKHAQYTRTCKRTQATPVHTRTNTKKRRKNTTLISKPQAGLEESLSRRKVDREPISKPRREALTKRRSFWRSDKRAFRRGVPARRSGVLASDVRRVRVGSLVW